MLTSVSSADGLRCVDIFRDPAGGFGFEHFRSDPEDVGRWTAVGGFASSRFSTSAEAAAAAEAAVFWLKEDARARASLAAWCTRPEC